MSDSPALLKPAELDPATAITRQICEQMDRCLLGRESLHRLVLTGLLSRGHILLEGLPGLGKTAWSAPSAIFCSSISIACSSLPT